MVKDPTSELFYVLQSYALAIANAWLPGIEGVYLAKIAANILHIADFARDVNSDMSPETNGRLRIDIFGARLDEEKRTTILNDKDLHSTKGKAIRALAEMPEYTAFLLQNRPFILEHFPGGAPEFNRIIGTLNECRSAALRSPLSRDLILQSEKRWEEIEAREGVALPLISQEQKEALMKRPLLKAMFEEQDQQPARTPPRTP